MKLIAALLVVFSATNVAATSRAFVPKSHASSKMLEMRGGAGPIDPVTMGKVASVVAITQGALGTAGPKAMNEQYGLSDENNDDMQQYHMKDYSTFVLSIGVMEYYLFFKDESIRKALKVSQVLWAYEMLRNIMSGDPISAGYSSTIALKVTLAIFVFTAYAMTQDYADAVIKAITVLWGLAGLQCVFAPEGAAKVWQLAEPESDEVNERMKHNCLNIGVGLLSTTILTGSHVFFDDVASTQALGYAIIPWLLLFVKDIIDGTDKKYNINEKMMIPWILYFAIIIVTTLL